MDSRDPTLAQLDALFAKRASVSYYMKKFENRMRHQRFTADDELLKLVEEAAAAMHRLATCTTRRVRRLRGSRSDREVGAA
jgi:hypothetical protein